MATQTIDNTYDAIKALVKEGLPENQAEAIVKSCRHPSGDDLVTETILNEQISELRRDLLTLRGDLFKWLGTMLVGQIAVFAIVVKWLIG